MLLIFLLLVPIVLWLIPLSGLRNGKTFLPKSFMVNFAAMLLLATIAAVIMWYMGMNSTTVLVVLLSISTCWGALFHLISNR